jgi:transporter family-2 protein
LSGTFEPGWLYDLGGGVLGALYAVVALITVSSIGAAGVVVATIAGQLTASVVIDRLGVLDLEETAVSPERGVGIGLPLLGTYPIVR